MRIEATQPIRAPLARVFEVFTDIEHSAGRIKGIKKVEVLSEVRSGKGLRWRETRSVFGSDADADKEITEFDPPHSYRVESNVNGMLYITTFQFAENADATVVTWAHDNTPLTFGAKLMSPFLFFMKGTIAKYMKQDLADLAEFLEKP